MSKTGQPPKFESGEQVISLWLEFCDSIIDGGYKQIPTQAAFCRWLCDNYADISERTLYNVLNKYFPTIKKEFRQIQSDVIMQGAMLGKYNATMAIFGLKNWCGWCNDGTKSDHVSDFPEDALSRALREEAEKIEAECEWLNSEQN